VAGGIELFSRKRSEPPWTALSPQQETRADFS
jgi:hypothetical protein